MPSRFPKDEKKYRAELSRLRASDPADRSCLVSLLSGPILECWPSKWKGTELCADGRPTFVGVSAFVYCTLKIAWSSQMIIYATPSSIWFSLLNRCSYSPLVERLSWSICKKSSGFDKGLERKWSRRHLTKTWFMGQLRGIGWRKRGEGLFLLIVSWVRAMSG